jgi:hypothetical protein
MREIITNNAQGCDNHPEQLSRRQIPARSQTLENIDSLRILIYKDTHSKDIGTTGVKVITACMRVLWEHNCHTSSCPCAYAEHHARI